METPATHMKHDPVIKLDREEIARYMKPPRHAPIAMVSKPPAESGLASQKFFLLTIHLVFIVFMFDQI